MNSRAKAIMIKQARCQILRNLDIVYPSGLTMKSLYQTVCSVDEMYDFNLLVKDIAYLRDKGYVKYVDDAMGGMGSVEKKVVKLTADGKEVAEGTDIDEALEI